MRFLVKLFIVVLVIVLVDSASVLKKKSCVDNPLSPGCDDRRQHPRLPEDGIKMTNEDLTPEQTQDYWLDIAKSFVSDQTKRTLNIKTAKNVIFFLGDGLGITTITAARMLLGGEEKKLSFEKFPYTGSSMTYCVDKQVADSACTATAYLTGVKGNYGTTGVNAKVPRYDCLAGQDRSTFTTSLAELAQRMGKSTGFVTTTRVTHASPSGLYTHIADRDWEDDSEIVNEGCNPEEIDDIAKQLIDGEVGKKFNVIMGGGRRHFRNNTVIDEEGTRGRRLDDRDLVQDWLSDTSKINSKYMWNREQLLALDTQETDHVLGLFEPAHMLYHLEAKAKDREDMEPTLPEMTQKALEIVRKNPNGFFIFIEGGKIDTAHHDNYVRTSLDETIEFHKSIALAREMFSEEDTLIVVTADHSHAVSMSGYPVSTVKHASDAEDLEYFENKGDELPSGGSEMVMLSGQENMSIFAKAFDTTAGLPQWIKMKDRFCVDSFGKTNNREIRKSSRKDNHSGKHIESWSKSRTPKSRTPKSRKPKSRILKSVTTTPTIAPALAEGKGKSSVSWYLFLHIISSLSGFCKFGIVAFGILAATEHFNYLQSFRLGLQDFICDQVLQFCTGFGQDYNRA